MTDGDYRMAALVRELDSADRDRRWAIWAELHRDPEAALRVCLDEYPSLRHREARSTLVYFATPYARSHEPAFLLGLAALRDRSNHVRYRAALLLAYSLRSDALPALRSRLAEEGHAETREDVKAAIRAVELGDHDLFLDRENSGRVFLEVEGLRATIPSAWEVRWRRRVRSAKRRLAAVGRFRPWRTRSSGRSG